jgi:nitrate reductase gamma subunit
MYDIVRGPLVWVSFLVFILGTTIQVMRFYRLSRLKRPPKFNDGAVAPGAPKQTGPLPTSSLRYKLEMLRLTILGGQPVMIVTTTIFHVCLVLTPLFVLAHNILLDLSWGISFVSVPESVTDALTVIVILGGLYFLHRRMFVYRVVTITTAYDYIVLLIVTAPFVSGFLAYHQVFDYHTLIFIHMLSGEILLMAIPFTKLVHMPFFFINRFVLIHENTLGRGGNRVWR